MDHHEKHHQQHAKERQEKIEEKKKHEANADTGIRSLHPAWFVGTGVVLIVLVLLVWMYVWSA